MQSDDQVRQWDRSALNAATKRMGEFAWPTVVYGVAVVVSYWSVVALVVLQEINVWWGAGLSGVLTYLAYTTLHESVHGSISGRRTALRGLNDALGYLSSTVLTLPMTVHRFEHLEHHRHTNKPQRDPDEILSDSGKSPVHLIANVVKFYTNHYHFYWQHRWPTAPASEKLKLTLELVVAWAPRLILVAQGFWLESLVLFVLGTVLGLVALLYLFAYIVHRPHDQIGRYVDTSTIRVPGVLGKLLTWVWVYQNYHSIHHLFPKVPFYRYAEVFDEIEAIMVQRKAPLYRLTLGGLVAQHQANVPAPLKI